MASVRGADDAFRIVLVEQDVFPVGELPDHLPRRRGRKVHRATGFRWAKHGATAADGALIRLPTLRLAGSLCTSAEALQWFCDRLSAGPVAAAVLPKRAARRREQEKRVGSWGRIGARGYPQQDSQKFISDGLDAEAPLEDRLVLGEIPLAHAVEPAQEVPNVRP
jgi:hypothetical protein